MILTLWHPAAFGDFRKKTPKCMWLCAGISLLLFGLRTWSSVKRRGKSFSLHSKKIFAWGVRVFCEWRHKWRTFRHLGPLYLALGANR